MPSSPEEREEAAYKELRIEMADRMGLPEREVNTAMDAIRDMSISEAYQYPESEYGISCIPTWEV